MYGGAWNLAWNFVGFALEAGRPREDGVLCKEYPGSRLVRELS
jgi:hypothetical protein